jgi:hypothetical protein
MRRRTVATIERVLERPGYVYTPAGTAISTATPTCVLNRITGVTFVGARFVYSN